MARRMVYRLTVEQMADALKKSRGNVSMAARALDVARTSLRRRIAASQTLQEVLRDEREAMVDILESVVYSQAVAGNITAAIFYLKASPEAKARGWGERHDVSGPNNGPVEIQVQWEGGTA